MNKAECSKRLAICAIEVIYLLGSVALTFGLWWSIIYTSGWFPEVKLQFESAVKSVVVWIAIPLTGFAWLFDLYAKRIKRGSKRLQRYGFIGRHLYEDRSKPAQKSG